MYTGRTMRIGLIFALMLAAITASNGQPPRKLKVLISVDMEGIAGVVSASQLGPGSFEYERFRRFMTLEALAAVEGAKQGGATEVVVTDAHGNEQNLLIELFPPDVRIVRGSPRRLGMMGGLDASFDAAMFVGYHASTSNSSGVRAHTFSSARFTRVTLNGTPVTEGAWNAAIAGQFGVPIVFASGDNSALAEIRGAIGDFEFVETKRTLGFHSAETLTPEAAQKLIREKAAEAMKELPKRKPYRAASPVAVAISFKSVTPVEAASYLAQVFTRVDSHTLSFTAKDMAEASDIVEFLMTYRIDLEP
jgi:D-amino peptidase